MKEEFKLLHSEEAHCSHMKGNLRIMGCFATSGVVIKAYFISDHHAYGSVGDHGMHVTNFSSQSVIGDNLPRVTKGQAKNSSGRSRQRARSTQGT